MQTQKSLLCLIVALAIQVCALPLATTSPNKPTTTSTKTTTTRTSTTTKTSTTKTSTTTTTTTTPGPLSPAQFLNLGYNWYVQLPTAKSANSTVYGSSSNPGLQTFISPNFYVNSTKDGAVFYTPNSGITTGGSDHPRTELREMCGPTGTLGSGWPSNDTIAHQLNVTMKVDAVPLTRIVVITQVFAVMEGAQYTYRAGYQNGKYYVALCTKSGCFTYDSNYTLGSLFSLNIEAFNNQVTTSYRNWVSGVTYKHTAPLALYLDYVFKAGSYCQVVKGVDDASAYCQVTFSEVSVTPC
ncbi:UNVERIFIED_CONTAM: hypothetical protein HDU68_004522 [Siphonaria sp. JEL0065]|nr:hypothetical protein HDU68_004522 [Siphonaria sp. JEL0065]